MDARVKCFECGRDLPAIPDYLASMGVKMRCNECAERHQASRPAVSLEQVSAPNKQITINRQRPRRPAGSLSDEAFAALVGLKEAA